MTCRANEVNRVDLLAHLDLHLNLLAVLLGAVKVVLAGGAKLGRAQIKESVSASLAVPLLLGLSFSEPLYPSGG